MNFKSLKNIVISAVSPIILLGSNHVALAGGGASTMRKSGTSGSRDVRGGRIIMCPVRGNHETPYEVHDISETTFETTMTKCDDSSEKHYEIYDMSRIVYETFNYTAFGKYNDNLSGPWRFLAYKKVEDDPKFENLIPEETARQVESENRLRRIASTMCWDPCLAGVRPPRQEVVLITADDPEFKYNYSFRTDNEDFEKIVEECRKEWNLVRDYKEPVRTPEEALKKALRILKSAFEDKDPFCNKPVKVSYDPIKKVYQIEPISKYAISEAHAKNILLAANGDVISIDLKGDEDLLRKLV